MTFRGAAWVLDQQAKGFRWATGNGKATEGKEEGFIPLALYGITQTAAIGITGHYQLAATGMKMQEYGKYTHKLIFPGAGTKYNAPFRIVRKNKWLVKGAKLGGRVVPGLNVALLGLDLYYTGKYLDFW